MPGGGEVVVRDLILSCNQYILVFIFLTKSHKSARVGYAIIQLIYETFI
jgi:hypothetical protein